MKNLFSRSRIKKCGCPRPSGNSALGCDDFTDRVGQELVKIDYSECQTYPFCPQNGGFSQWSTWSECDCHDLVQAFKSTTLNDYSNLMKLIPKFKTLKKSSVVNENVTTLFPDSVGRLAGGKCLKFHPVTQLNAKPRVLEILLLRLVVPAQ